MWASTGRKSYCHSSWSGEKKLAFDFKVVSSKAKEGGREGEKKYARLQQTVGNEKNAFPRMVDQQTR